MNTEHVPKIDYLANRKEFIPLLSDWLIEEWKEWYGITGPGDAESDLRSAARLETLPIGLVATFDETLVGYINLKHEPIEGYRDFGPWAGAVLVHPAARGRGIGTLLVQHLEDVARNLGYTSVYSGNRTHTGIMKRNNWLHAGSSLHNQELIYVYHKAL
ncbi:GNAT family N-acetyltransferase [Bowmanella pacifica]|uniref:N-acetyltransferase domain-containing protein n=1 Tax=Bowmanella pacifica TaxID=502051 RepID=A0A917YZR2_9ALTE|nr:GNAT family N-acetyltransferase [Bowmanella pacifica]GGO70799.1 hypothetical protein GCM10010982_25170 [Bowmanella pacifica]